MDKQQIDQPPARRRFTAAEIMDAVLDLKKSFDQQAHMFTREIELLEQRTENALKIVRDELHFFSNGERPNPADIPGVMTGEKLLADQRAEKEAAEEHQRLFAIKCVFEWALERVKQSDDEISHHDHREGIQEHQSHKELLARCRISGRREGYETAAMLLQEYFAKESGVPLEEIQLI